MTQAFKQWSTFQRVQFVTGILFTVAGIYFLFQSRWVDAGWNLTLGIGSLIVLYMDKRPELAKGVAAWAFTIVFVVLLVLFTVMRSQAAAL